jgi:hypothetical protein
VDAAEVAVAIGEEVDRLRASGVKGVHRISVKGKDYDIDLDNYKTGKDGGECLQP